MACQATRKEKVVLAQSLHPEYREVSSTYARFQDIPITEVGYKDGMMDLEALEKLLPKKRQQ